MPIIDHSSKEAIQRLEAQIVVQRLQRPHVPHLNQLLVNRGHGLAAPHEPILIQIWRAVRSRVQIPCLEYLTQRQVVVQRSGAMKSVVVIVGKLFQAVRAALLVVEAPRLQLHVDFQLAAAALTKGALFQEALVRLRQGFERLERFPGRESLGYSPQRRVALLRRLAQTAAGRLELRIGTGGVARLVATRVELVTDVALGEVGRCRTFDGIGGRVKVGVGA